MARRPALQDKFSFGLRTVGWTGTDPFGGPSRPALDPWEYAERLAELGAWGVTFHDNDVFAFDADEATRERVVGRFKEATDAAGLVIEMVTTNTFSHPATSGPKGTTFGSHWNPSRTSRAVTSSSRPSGTPWR